MDARTSCWLWTLDFGLWTLDFHRLCFFDKSERRVVQISQLQFDRLELRELHEVTALEKIAEAVLLVAREQIGFLQFVEKFLRRLLRRVELESLFQIEPQRV